MSEETHYRIDIQYAASGLWQPWATAETLDEARIKHKAVLDNLPTRYADARIVEVRRVVTETVLPADSATGREYDELLHGIFTTALEGGIGYWSYAETYHWMGDDPEARYGEPGYADLEGFKAVIHDTEGENFGQEGEDAPLVINREVIQKGLDLFNAKTWRNDYFGAFTNAVINQDWDDVDYDADIADIIVQLGLFGEVVFG